MTTINGAHTPGHGPSGHVSVQVPGQRRDGGRLTSGVVNWANVSSFLRRHAQVVHLVLLAAILALWEFAVKAGLLEHYVLSQPSEVVPEFVDYVTAGNTWQQLWITVSSLWLGLLGGSTLGIVVATALARRRQVRSAFEPVIMALYTIPRLALVPLFLVWFGFGMTPQVLVAAIHAFVIFYLAMSAALASLPKELVLSVLSMGGRTRELSRYVTMPYAATHLLSAFRQSLALGLGSVIVAEMIGPRGGLGFMLSSRLGMFDTTAVVALIILAALLAVALDQLSALVERRVLRWAQ